MCSVRKWRRSVLTKRKRSAETYWLTVDALSFLVWNRYAWLLSNLLRSELVGRLIKMLGKVTDDADVGFCGMMRVITALEFLQHFFAKLRHRDLLFCDPTYLNSLAFTPPNWLPLAHAQASAAPAAWFKSLCHK